MRVKVALQGPNAGARSYLIHIPSHLIYIHDLADYLGSKSELAGNQACRVNLSIDGSSLFPNDRVADLIREGDLIK